MSHETHEFDIEGLQILCEEILAEAKVEVLYTMVAGDILFAGDSYPVGLFFSFIVRRIYCILDTRHKEEKQKWI